MMQTENKTQNKNITFSKWSSKGYAAFASLGKVVKIARLKVDICMQSFHKNINLLNECLQVGLNSLIEILDEKESAPLPDLLMLFAVATEGNNKISCQLSNKFLIKNNSSPCLAFAIHGFFNFTRYD